MRGAGCTINDIWDREIDKQVERTKTRPLARGAVSLNQALAWTGVQLGLSAVLLFSLEPAAVVTPFFGLITPVNCEMLGLPHFFDKVVESCSLANISVRLLFSASPLAIMMLRACLLFVVILPAETAM